MATKREELANPESCLNRARDDDARRSGPAIVHQICATAEASVQEVSSANELHGPIGLDGKRIVVRCHCCQGTQIWKRNEAGEIEVYHDCASGLHAMRLRAEAAEAGMASEQKQNQRLSAQMRNMDKALALAAQLVEAITPLIPSPESLSSEQCELWQKVVNVVFAAAAQSGWQHPASQIPGGQA